MPDFFELNRERKIILIGGAVLLLLGAIYRFYPVIAAVSFSGNIDLKQVHLEKYQKMAGQKRAVEKEKSYVARVHRQAESRFLTGETPALAAVEIQEILNGIAKDADVEFQSMRVMKPEANDVNPYVRLPVQFSMNSDIVQLREIIYRIETASKLLVITELDSRKPRLRDSTVIRSTVTVEGVMKSPENGNG